MKHMPKVMQDQFKRNGGSRTFSTSARSRLPDVQNTEPSDDTAALLASMIKEVDTQAGSQAVQAEQAEELNTGLKFDVPEGKTLNFRKRYDSMQDQFTKMLMQDGKLARAQKV